MKGSLRLNRRKPRISLRSSHQINTNCSTRFSSRTRNKIHISHTTSHSNHTRKEGVVKNLEEEVEVKYLVEEEVKLHAITMENWVTMP